MRNQVLLRDRYRGYDEGDAASLRSRRHRAAAASHILSSRSQWYLRDWVDTVSHIQDHWASCLQGPPINCRIFTTLFWRLNVQCNDDDQKKVINFWGRKCTARKKCTSRENPGYAYEKGPCLTVVWGPRMVNPALVIFIPTRVIHICSGTGDVDKTRT